MENHKARMAENIKRIQRAAKLANEAIQGIELEYPPANLKNTESKQHVQKVKNTVEKLKKAETMLEQEYAVLSGEYAQHLDA